MNEIQNSTTEKISEAKSLFFAIIKIVKPLARLMGDK